MSLTALRYYCAHTHTQLEGKKQNELERKMVLKYRKVALATDDSQSTQHTASHTLHHSPGQVL